MPKRAYLLLLLLIAISIVVFFVFKNQQSTVLQPQSTSPTSPTPFPTVLISLPAIQVNKGVITALTDTIVSIQVEQVVKTLSLEKVIKVERVVRGTIEEGNVELVPAQVSDLAVGREIRVFGPDNSAEITIIWIIQ